EEQNDPRERKLPARRAPLSRNFDAGQLDVASPRDATSDPGGAGQQARAVPPVLEFGHHVVAAGFTCEPVRDPLLELVTDLDPYAPLVERQQDQQAVVLPLVADAASAILEHLDGKLADLGVRLDRLDGGDDH